MMYYVNSKGQKIDPKEMEPPHLYFALEKAKREKHKKNIKVLETEKIRRNRP